MVFLQVSYKLYMLSALYVNSITVKNMVMNKFLLFSASTTLMHQVAYPMSNPFRPLWLIQSVAAPFHFYL